MMFEQFLYLILAILGLGFLVFIHELGHFWMARREGMKVEAFSIGFGPVVHSWIREGVRWQICWLPFGGYVKIAGMVKEGSREPYEIANGFYSKTPKQRIFVALMGPLVNLAFALFAFCVIWMTGGQEKPFQEFTHRIGWIDPHSSFYAKGLRPGDIIQSCDGRELKGFNDLLIASVSQEYNRIQGYKVDYFTGEKSAFDTTFQGFKSAHRSKDLAGSFDIPSPAQYLIYQDGGKPLAATAPMAFSGIQNNDRILWVDGEMIFSMKQLSNLINESSAFVTVLRGETIFQTRVPRVYLNELKLTSMQKAELDDWQHETHLKGRVQDLLFIPYLLSPSGEVEMRLSFIDEADQKKAFDQCQRCSYYQPLEEGDKICAIDGQAITSSYDLLSQLQTRRALVIVQRDPEAIAKISWNAADQQFDQNFNPAVLQEIVSKIGIDEETKQIGDLVLLQPIVPKPLTELAISEEQRKQNDRMQDQNKKAIDAIEDQGQRELALKQYELGQKKVFLGIQLVDRKVIYNPTPIEQFSNVLSQTWLTLKSLFTGNLSPKHLSGPVGIVQAVHYGWMKGAKEALFWMGFVSLNLGIVNLLPVPVFDGGHIMFALFEKITKRRLSANTMEWLVIPFVGLLIAFFIYITYQDIVRIFSGFF